MAIKDLAAPEIALCTIFEIFYFPSSLYHHLPSLLFLYASYLPFNIFFLLDRSNFDSVYTGSYRFLSVEMQTCFNNEFEPNKSLVSSRISQIDQSNMNLKTQVQTIAIDVP